MNIEDIKEQLSDMQRLVYTHIEPDMYESHVKYLLHILDLLEQDLTYMKQHGELTNMDGKMKYCIDGALKAIRGN